MSADERASASSSPDADAAMDRFADGDDSAFGEVYRALEPRLLQYAIRRTGDRAQAEDLVQHTFEMMISARGRFVRGSRIIPWAFAILRHRNCDMKRRPRVEQLSADGEPATQHPTPQPDPHQCLETRQRAQVVRRELERLPRCQRDAFELVHYEHLSHAEAAEVLDATVAGIKSRIQRAHDALRAALHDARETERP